MPGIARLLERMTGGGHELGCIERVTGVAGDAGRHRQRVAYRAGAQRLSHPIGDHPRAGLGGVDEDRDRDAVAHPEHGVALAQGPPRHRAEGRERLLSHLDRRRPQAVELPEDDRHRQHLATGRRHHLLEEDGEVTLAEQPRHRVDLPVGGVGPLGELDLRRARGRQPVLLGHRDLQRLQLPAQATGLRPRLPERVLGAAAADVDECADAGGGDAHHRRREPERRFVGDDRGDPEDHRDHRERCARRHAAVVVALRRCLHHEGTVTSSASSAMMSLTRKSFGV